MTDLDHEFQQRLADLENGVSPDQVADRLPAEAAELRPLVKLAAAVRDAPHPLPSPAHTQALGQKILQASANIKRKDALPPHRSLRTWLIGSSFLAVAVILVCLFTVTVGAGLWLYGPPAAHTASLQAVSGTVEIARDGTSWQAASGSTRLSQGWAVRTGPDSAATLVFYDGSRTTLGPDSEMVLTRLDGRWGGVVQVVMEQVSGLSTHQVVPFRGRNSQFLVNTPAGQASVHGTTFRVAVDEHGQASFSVDAGEVQVSNAESSVSVRAGQATRVSPDKAPSAPVYQFSLADELTAVEGNVWTMKGVSFRVSDETILLAQPRVGDAIQVNGRILEDGWVADSIVTSPAEETLTFQFSGLVEAMGAESWQVNGAEILVNEVTEIDGDIDIGDPVRVTYALLYSGSWQALEIENLAFEIPPTPLPTIVNCTGADPQPRAQELAQEYGVSYDEIMGWFCQGFGFGEIDQAYELGRQSGLPVGDIFALRRSGLGWGEIRQRLQMGLTPTPPITPTATLVASMTPTPAITVTVTPTPQPTVVNCTGANPQPKAQTLADQYGVPYEEIMGWFCQGFGFGEIDLAYSLSVETGVPVADIFAMKSAGQGWGEIKKELTGTARPPKDKGGSHDPGATPEPRKPKGKDKTKRP